MPELTKQEVKEVVIGAIEPFAKAVQADLQTLKADVGVLKGEVHEVRSELREFKQNASELFAKLDEFISLYRSQEMELASLAA